MRAPLALVLGYLLLLGAWSIGNPPGAAPDELAHYLRALAAGRGELILEKRPEPLTAPGASEGLSFQRKQTRVVRVPGPLSAELFNCNRSTTLGRWDCPPPASISSRPLEENTWVGTYPPYLYIAPGLFMNFAGTAVGALLVGRMVSMSMAFGLLAAAILLLYDPGRRWCSLMGLMAAMTPMALFVASSLSPSGPEIAAGACLAAAMFRLTRPERIRRPVPDPFAWTAAGVSGLVLVAGRDLGPAWLALYGLMVLALTGRRRLLAVLRNGGGPAILAFSLIGCGLAAAVYWQLGQQVRAEMDVGGMVSGLGTSLRVTREVARQEIGVFGQLAVVMHPLAYLAWGVLLAALGIAALIAGNLRERCVLAAAVLAGVMVPVGVDQLQRLGGFGVQGRHVLPLTIAIPLLAGEIVTRHTGELRRLERLRPGLLVSLLAALIGGYAWYLNAKFYMVGVAGPDPFWRSVRSSPPLGWSALVGTAALGAVLMLAFGYLVSRQPAADGSDGDAGHYDAGDPHLAGRVEPVIRP